VLWPGGKVCSLPKGLYIRFCSRHATVGEYVASGVRCCKKVKADLVYICATVTHFL
jgi:hypothetical protein